MSRVRVIVFDLGGVLLPFDRERRVKAVAERFRIAPEVVRDIEAALAGRLDRGEADEHDLALALSEAAGRELDLDEVIEAWLTVFEAPNAELWDLAVALKDRVRVAGFSDNPAFVRRMLRDGDLFEPLFLSCDLGSVKPTPAAFAAVQAGLGAAAEEILFVDDSPANVEAAERAGWDGICYASNAQLRIALAQRGLA